MCSARDLGLLRRALRHEQERGEVSWDRLPLELPQIVQWTADRLQAQERLRRGWDKIHSQAFKDICQFCQVRLQARDDSVPVWDHLPQRHCERCNVCFNCLIHYDSSSASASNRCTWYEAHFQNGLRITVLDDDLSQAQLAQVEDLLDIDIAYDYLF